MYRPKKYDRTITLRVPSQLLEKVAYYAERDGYKTLSDLVRDLLQHYVLVSERYSIKVNKQERAAALTSLFRRLAKT
ncbi:MAG: ribbon-helix-helix domain-containing protein [Desulfurococcales archaeon]|nr:ribbon-helix-helix domain-containing protein [Desulfurococcales archaeon]